MTRFLILFMAAVLAACGPSPEEQALNNASKNAVHRVWTDPEVADAIGYRSAMVADFKPGRDILFSSIPTSIGMAQYGEFDEFVLVMFDLEKATHQQVRAGMKSYCENVIKRPLIQVHGGVMDAPVGTNHKPLGYISGKCRA